LDATVIIPTYNRPELLGRQLACLAGQANGVVREVLVCDDGSSTDTQTAMAPYFSGIPGLRLLHQDDQGFRAGQARNMGIREARGDVLIFTDDDVLLPGDFVRHHVAAHKKSGNGAPARQLVLGFRYRTRTQPDRLPPTAGEILGCEPDSRVDEIGARGQALDDCDHPWFYVYSCNFSVRNEPEAVRFDERFEGWGMEDTELGYRLTRQGYAVCVEPRACVLHVESRQPRDPFVCEERGLPPQYDSYVRNMVRFLDKYPEDRILHRVLASDLRWYVRDASGRHWIKDGHEHDADAVIAEERRLTAGQAASVKRPAPAWAGR
jgi:glycosyltransferase involved in cell wall biosynthesis